MPLQLLVKKDASLKATRCLISASETNVAMTIL